VDDDVLVVVPLVVVPVDVVPVDVVQAPGLPLAPLHA
jgi:hypothetical protein